MPHNNSIGDPGFLSLRFPSLRFGLPDCPKDCKCSPGEQTYSYNGTAPAAINQSDVDIRKCQPFTKNAPRDRSDNAMERARVSLSIALSNHFPGRGTAHRIVREIQYSMRKNPENCTFPPRGPHTKSKPVHGNLTMTPPIQFLTFFIQKSGLQNWQKPRFTPW